ncbi:unnamed protein product [Periconia digitata]|uniref:Uncharacterized protein n=1 Tax=Periconia digitata TaxID=1303443 RepID=A0A9W4UR13_9PLEO|nr:unnamed protein product [Periconia digitata]
MGIIGAKNIQQQLSGREALLSPLHITIYLCTSMGNRIRTDYAFLFPIIERVLLSRA